LRQQHSAPVQQQQQHPLASSRHNSINSHSSLQWPPAEIMSEDEEDALHSVGLCGLTLKNPR
jgi:hypothetical protein